jgi:hypothetical protein
MIWRRDDINIEVANVRDLLPVHPLRVLPEEKIDHALVIKKTRAKIKNQTLSSQTSIKTICDRDLAAFLRRGMGIT